jgi:hypothetical protein
MIKRLLAILLLISGLTATSAVAAPLPTNFIQTISLQLLVVAPGKTASNGLSVTVSNLTILTKDAIKAIGLATSNNFSAKAQLIAIAPISYYSSTVTVTNKGKTTTITNTFGYPGNPSFQVRDGTNIVDVTHLVTIITLNSNSYLASYTLTKKGAYTSYKTYRLRSIMVSTSALSFSCQGFVETPTLIIPVKAGTVVYGWDDDWSDVSGMGTEGTLSGILKGTIAATFTKLE